MAKMSLLAAAVAQSYTPRIDQRGISWANGASDARPNGAILRADGPRGGQVHQKGSVTDGYERDQYREAE